jgi:hypothetical protein
MSELFDKDKRTISEHIKNIFNEGELQESMKKDNTQKLTETFTQILNKIFQLLIRSSQTKWPINWRFTVEN